MKRIKRFEQFHVRAGGHVPMRELQDKLETFIAKEGLTPDWVDYRAERGEPVVYITPKRHFVRQRGVMKGMTAHLYWYEDAP